MNPDVKVPALTIPTYAQHPRNVELALTANDGIERIRQALRTHPAFRIHCAYPYQTVTAREVLLRQAPEIFTIRNDIQAACSLLLEAQPAHMRHEFPEGMFDDPTACARALHTFWEQFGGWYAASQITRADFETYTRRAARHEHNPENTEGPNLGDQAELLFDVMMRLLCNSLARSGGKISLLSDASVARGSRPAFLQEPYHVEFYGSRFMVFDEGHLEKGEYDGAFVLDRGPSQPVVTCVFDCTVEKGHKGERIKRKRDERNATGMFVNDERSSVLAFRVMMHDEAPVHSDPCARGNIHLPSPDIQQAIRTAAIPVEPEDEYEEPPDAFEEFRLKLDAAARSFAYTDR
jgi:hypothetical protein